MQEDIAIILQPSIPAVKASIYNLTAEMGSRIALSTAAPARPLSFNLFDFINPFSICISRMSGAMSFMHEKGTSFRLNFVRRLRFNRCLPFRLCVQYV